MGDTMELTTVEGFHLDESVLRLGLKIYKCMDKNINLCLSPLGLHQMLSVLSTLCKDDAGQLLQILGSSEDDVTTSAAVSDLNRRWREFLTDAQQYRQVMKLSFGAFSKYVFDPSEDMCKIITDCYRGERNTLQEETINKFLVESTEGMVKSLKTDFNRAVSLYLSVVYFKDKWARSLEWKVERDLDFNVTDRMTVKTDYISDQSAVVEYTFDEKMQTRVLKLRYINPNFFLLVLLPKHMETLENDMTDEPDLLSRWMKPMPFQKVYISLPKFLIESQLDVMKLLKNVTGNSNLTLLDHQPTNYGPYVADVRQMNKFEVNEFGTRAVSATSTLIAECINVCPNMFIANKPFVFVLGYKTSALFIGRVYNPQQK